MFKFVRYYLYLYVNEMSLSNIIIYYYHIIKPCNIESKITYVVVVLLVFRFFWPILRFWLRQSLWAWCLLWSGRWLVLLFRLLIFFRLLIGLRYLVGWWLVRGGLWLVSGWLGLVRSGLRLVSGRLLVSWSRRCCWWLLVSWTASRDHLQKHGSTDWLAFFSLLLSYISGVFLLGDWHRYRHCRDTGQQKTL